MYVRRATFTATQGSFELTVYLSSGPLLLISLAWDLYTLEEQKTVVQVENIAFHKRLDRCMHQSVISQIGVFPGPEESQLLVSSIGQSVTSALRFYIKRVSQEGAKRDMRNRNWNMRLVGKYNMFIGGCNIEKKKKNCNITPIHSVYLVQQ